MTGWELLVREFDELKEDYKELKKEVVELRQLVQLLMFEREQNIQHDIAVLKTLKEWDEYNKAEAAAND